MLKHACLKAEAMQVPLSVDCQLQDLLDNVRVVRERMVLRPSAALVEASDYLSHKHDAAV